MYSLLLFLQRNTDVSLGKDYLFKLKNVFLTAKKKKNTSTCFFIKLQQKKRKEIVRMYKKGRKKDISSRFWKMNLANISAILEKKGQKQMILARTTWTNSSEEKRDLGVDLDQQ